MAKKIIGVTSLMMALVFIVACTPSANTGGVSETPTTVVERESDEERINDLLMRVETLETAYEVLQQEKTLLDKTLEDKNSQIEVMMESFENRVGTIEQDIEKTKSTNTEEYAPGESSDTTYNELYKDINANKIDIAMLDYNIRTLFSLTGVDEYQYLNYKIDEAIDRASNFEQLMGVYSRRLDGAYAEGFASKLYTIYQTMTIEEYLEAVTAYESKIITNLGGYLAFSMGPSSVEKFIEEMDALEDDYQEMEAFMLTRNAVQSVW